MKQSRYRALKGIRKMVKIYLDPLTEQQPEGDAQVIKRLQTMEREGLGLFLVHFKGDPEDTQVERLIKLPRVE